MLEEPKLGGRAQAELISSRNYCLLGRSSWHEPYFFLQLLLLICIPFLSVACNLHVQSRKKDTQQEKFPSMLWEALSTAEKKIATANIEVFNRTPSWRNYFLSLYGGFVYQTSLLSDAFIGDLLRPHSREFSFVTEYREIPYLWATYFKRQGCPFSPHWCNLTNPILCSTWNPMVVVGHRLSLLKTKSNILPFSFLDVYFTCLGSGCQKD